MTPPDPLTVRLAALEAENDRLRARLAALRVALAPALATEVAATAAPWVLERGERLVTTRAVILHGPDDLGPVLFGPAANAPLVLALRNALPQVRALLEEVNLDA